MKIQYCTNDARTAFVDQGNKSATPLVLVGGLNQQLITWPEYFVDGLLNLGYRVIRLDNRDSGFSRSYDELKCPSFSRLTLFRWFGVPVDIPYSLEDMAWDVIKLLDHLSLPSAHIIGISMGGMIGQILAGKYPSRVSSFTCINSSSGKLGKGLPSLAVSKAMIEPTPAGMTPIDNSVRVRQMFGSPEYPETDDYVREQVKKEHDRARNIKGYFRQMAAARRAPNRKNMLKKIVAPTLIIHGEDDQLVNVNGGKETKKHIRHAKFVTFKGMGHNMPRELLKKFLTLISQNIAEGENFDSTK